MSISISQTDNVGLTVESDPLALKLTGGTLSGKVNTVATTTANAGLSIPIGPAPTVPVDGDFWMSSVGPVVRLAGVTQNIPTAGLNNTFTGVNTFTSTLNYSGSNSNYGSATGASSIGISVGATTNGSTKAVNIGTNGLAGSTTNITVGSTTGTSTTTLQGITNGVTQTVADNSTKLATTGYVSNSISSTSFIRMSAISGSGASSGTGASASILVNGFNSRSPTTLVGYGIYSFALTWHSRGSGSNLSIPLNWNKRFVAQFRFHPRTLGTEANTINRVLFGKANGTTTGELTLRGVGVRQIANGALELVVHDGTTFTAVTSSYTPVVNSSTDIRIVSDGAGNVTLFNNDTQIATTSAGASTAGSTNNAFLTIESENIGVITGTNNTLYVGEISFEFAQ